MISRIHAAIRALISRSAQPLRLLWRLHPPVIVVVSAAPIVVLQTLGAGARPSTQRLHLRDLFRDGRRYYIQPLTDGFRMTSDSRQVYGNRRRRTRVAALLYGRFTMAQNDELTIIRLRTRVSVGYMLSALLIPAFISSIIVYMPWNISLIGVLIGLLFGLSLVAHLLNAVLQATEMVYFVQKVMQDLPQPEIMPLQASSPDVVLRPTVDDPLQTGFREAWQKFYERKSEAE
jgi:hypothetical protein